MRVLVQSGVLALMLSASVHSLMASQLCVILEERANLPPVARQLLLSELGAVSHGKAIDARSCLLVRIREAPGQRYSTALGLVQVRQGRVLPLIELYVRPVKELLGRDLHAAALGKALARVAAHELTHYREQRLDHGAAGSFRESLGPGDLTGRTR